MRSRNTQQALIYYATAFDYTRSSSCVQPLLFSTARSIPNPYWVDAADGSKLACSYHGINPAAITVVYFHGNGEVVADYLPGFSRLADAGWI